jgi:hypothetical protein
MKRSSTINFVPASKELPRITKTVSHIYNDRKTREQIKPVSPPSEEMVKKLNSIGREYPFCVNYKQKMNDPL